MRRLAIAAALLATPASAQTITGPSVDASAVQTQLDSANKAGAQALAAAQAAQTAAAASVKTVAGNVPDANGNASLPSSYSAITCAGCSFTGTTMTGTTMSNGSAVATVADIAAEVSNRNAAIAAYVPPVTSVNGQTGAVNVAGYTDAQARAANATAISTATSLAQAASADSIQIVNPASASTVATNTGVNVLFINNAALLASLTVTFPASPVDGQRFTVAANNTVTTLGFSGAVARGAASTLSASGYARFVYSTTLALWFRVG